ncbi:hypothetical protein J6590_002728 [Homalodisca vitripennis]|nr:hypothetical protein J6590_002728 [Homalodisca vitripennis]
MDENLRSDEIRREVSGEFSSSESELSIFRNLSDSEDPSVHLSDLDYGSDSDPNLSDNEPDGVQCICEKPPNNDIDLPIALPGENEDEIFLNPEDDVIVWQNVKGALNEFIFSPPEPPGVTKAASDKISTNKPFEFYSLFVDDEVLDLLVTETNKYAEQCIVQAIV